MNRTPARTGAMLAGALLASVLGLSGCDGDRSAVQPPAPAASATPAPTVGELSSTGQGLEIRYLDEHGDPQVLAPKDFPHR